MLPVLRRTWAPCGVTPTLFVRARSHEKVSGIGALIVSPRASPAHPRLGAVPAGEHPGPAGAALSPPSRASRARSRRPRLGSRPLPQAPPGHGVAGDPSALAPRLVSALHARAESRGTALGLSQVRPSRESRSRHRRGDPLSREPRAAAAGPTPAVTEELLPPLGAAFSRLR